MQPFCGWDDSLGTHLEQDVYHNFLLLFLFASFKCMYYHVRSFLIIYVLECHRDMT